MYQVTVKVIIFTYDLDNDELLMVVEKKIQNKKHSLPAIILNGSSVKPEKLVIEALDITSKPIIQLWPLTPIVEIGEVYLPFITLINQQEIVEKKLESISLTENLSLTPNDKLLLTLSFNHLISIANDFNPKERVKICFLLDQKNGFKIREAHQLFSKIDARYRSYDISNFSKMLTTTCQLQIVKHAKRNNRFRLL